MAAAALALAVPALALSRPSTTVAAVSKGEVRAVVTAQKTSGGLSPTASVAVVVYHRSSGKWHRTGTHKLGSGFFWKVVSHSHAICKLALSGSSLTVSVLVTPSIGCAPIRTIRIES
jgi:hypothetical protein